MPSPSARTAPSRHLSLDGRQKHGSTSTTIGSCERALRILGSASSSSSDSFLSPFRCVDFPAAMEEDLASSEEFGTNLMALRE
ncbi:hypothetical protein MPTK1_6g16110 [Marchantia polymorpha subsp. ruderalis]